MAIGPAPYLDAVQASVWTSAVFKRTIIDRDDGSGVEGDGLWITPARGPSAPTATGPEKCVAASAARPKPAAESSA
jgi:hypothetical protein